MFEITIKEKRTVKKVVGNVWAVIGEKEEIREISMYDPRDADAPRTRIAQVYGYTLEIEKAVDEEREVLKQTVDELDLAAVIKAINKL